ncbi:MAG: hypothetical protein L0H88_04960, partial [Propionibacterium sp.]|nr:hypothetical protein [Propionibacterium sp.]
MDAATEVDDRRAALSERPRPGGGPSWFVLHPRATDLLVVLAVFVYNLPIQFGAVPKDLWLGTGLVVSVGLCAPYLLRRRHPVAVYAAVQLVAVVQVMLGISLLPADAVLLLVVYTVAVSTRWRVSAPCAAVTAVWVVAATEVDDRRAALSERPRP